MGNGEIARPSGSERNQNTCSASKVLPLLTIKEQPQQGRRKTPLIFIEIQSGAVGQQNLATHEASVANLLLDLQLD